MKLLSIAAGWPTVGLLFLLAGCLSRVRKTRGHALLLLVPAGVLFFRKIALYLPIPGALATEDGIAFWSIGAAIYMCVQLIWQIGFTATAATDPKFIGLSTDSSQRKWTTAMAGFGFGLLIQYVGYGGGVIASAILLPVDGWSHVPMPLAACVALPKLLLINPLLLPAVLAGLLLHAWLAVFGGWRGLWHIYPVLLLIVVVAGLVQLGGSFAVAKKVQAAVHLTESWGGPDEISDYYTRWIARLADIRRCGVNSVEAEPVAYTNGCRLFADLREAPSVWRPLLGGLRLVAFASGMLVWALAAMLARVRWRGRLVLRRAFVYAPATQAEPDGTPLSLARATEHYFGALAWPGAIAFVLLAAVVWFFGAVDLMPLILGTLASSALLVAAYQCSYSVFCSKNSIRGALCPVCLTTIWKVCCAQCRRPVPPLALRFGGFFLKNCGECQVDLSSGGGYLATQCSICDGGCGDPRCLFRKPTRLMLWVDDQLPAPRYVDPQWRIIFQSARELRLYAADDPISANLLIFRNDYRQWDTPLPSHLLRRTRLLLIAASLPEMWKARIRGHFGPETIVIIMEPLAQLMRRPPTHSAGAGSSEVIA